MTNYNDGNWYDWGGEKCPVHPKSTVDCIWNDYHDEQAYIVFGREAQESENSRFTWANVVKFRVVKEFKEVTE